MKIRLKTDWDFTPKISTSSGHFTGRLDVKNRLINELTRRDNGAILVTGSRGVGKTSLVYESVRTISSKTEQKDISRFIRLLNWVKNGFKKKVLVQILPVLVNASQLDIDSIKIKKDMKVVRKEILVNLIRCLYSSLVKLDSKNISDIENLYKIALSSDHKTSAEINNRHSTDYNFNLFNKLDLINLIQYLLPLIISMLPFFINYQFNILNGLSGNIVISVVSFFSFIFSLKVTKQRSISAINKEIYIKDDNSATNLEIELEKVLTRLSKFYKPIFIIDELDYFEKSIFVGNNETNVVQIVKTYKNLFNLSDAIFIFIAGEKTWDKIRAALRKDIQHTAFSSQIYLCKPDFIDVKQYIKDISVDSAKWNSTLGISYINYLLFKARSEFFDLKMYISNNLSEFSDNGTVTMSLKNPPSTLIIRQSKVQEVIESLYNYQKSNNFDDNDNNYQLLEHIYNLSETITNQNVFVLNKYTNGSWTLPDEDQSIKRREWFINFVNVLEWLKLIQEVFEEEKQTDINDPKTKYYSVHYKWTNKTPRIPKKINQIETQEKLNCKKNFEYLSNLISKIINIYNYLDKGHKYKAVRYSINSKISTEMLDFVSEITKVALTNIYDEQYSFVFRLNKIIPDYINASEINEHTQVIKDILDQIQANYLKIISNIIYNLLRKKFDNISLLSLSDNMSLVSDHPKLFKLLQDKVGYIVGYSGGKNLIISNNLLINEYKESSPSIVRRLNKIRILNISNFIIEKESTKSTKKTFINISNNTLNLSANLSSNDEADLKRLKLFINWITQ